MDVLVATADSVGNGVVARGTKWPTPTQPADGQPAPAPGAVLSDGVVGVGGTAREKPAGRQRTLTLHLVPLNGSQQSSLSFPQRVDRSVLMCDDCHSEPRV